MGPSLVCEGLRGGTRSGLGADEVPLLYPTSSKHSVDSDDGPPWDRAAGLSHVVWP
jgi:hypothetical protein